MHRKNSTHFGWFQFPIVHSSKSANLSKLWNLACWKGNLNLRLTFFTVHFSSPLQPTRETYRWLPSFVIAISTVGVLDISIAPNPNVNSCVRLTLVLLLNSDRKGKICAFLLNDRYSWSRFRIVLFTTSNTSNQISQVLNGHQQATELVFAVTSFYRSGATACNQ